MLSRLGAGFGAMGSVRIVAVADAGEPSDPLETEGYISAIEYVIDGAGSTIVSPESKGYLEVPFDCTITAARLLADRSGSIAIEVRKCTYAQFDSGATHPVTGDKISASAPPTISNATKSSDTTLSGWTTTLTEGDILEFYVSSCSTIRRCTITLDVTGT